MTPMPRAGVLASAVPEAASGTAPSRPTLLFEHGWAFDGSLWDALRPHLADWPQVVADAGYFGAPGPARPGGPIVAIGHSHGFLRLVQEGAPDWAGWVAINGFSRFTGADDFPAGVAPRVLQRMLARFDVDPATVVDDFRLRCGSPPAGRPLDTDRLGAGLRVLAGGAGRAALARGRVPGLALAGEADPIVPPALTRASFGGLQGTRIEWRAGGKHVLPVTAPDWCAGHIRRYLEGLAGPGRAA
ncbi:alpha/beta hydrolase [Pigmentiphaga soli]|uniref:Alpha/beta hydrolase n=1 Tax=Pigmentiphaga soli TaxID=1007095 RepID=A0ABP8GJS7_9BURK